MYRKSNPAADLIAAIIKVLLGVIIGAVTLFGGAAITGIFVMLLWNWLVPVIFVGAVATGTVIGTITWVQGWGLSVICGMLFKVSCSSSSKD